MKLISIRLDSEFNSLLPFTEKDISHAVNNGGKIDPLCLIGINGSGKSNLLELIVEAFYYLEYNHRFNVKKKKKSNRKFELVYSLKKWGNKKIKIDTISTTFAKIFVENTDVNDGWIEIIESNEILEYLPNQIVGYTSGMNETLSFRFNQLDELYSDEVLMNARQKSKVTIPNNRMVFMENESNEGIVVANFLFKEKNDLKVFEDLLRITDLDTFKIILNLKKKRGTDEYVILSNELLDYIEKFKKCSVCYSEDKLKLYEFDFINNKATKEAFKNHFGSVYNLFMAFQKFKLLNPINLERTYRKTKSEDDLLDNKPTLAKHDKVFRFEEINLNISKPAKSIPYIGISDGEHQFLQVVGSVMIFEQDDTLFLFDEPETHFNPAWRTQFIKILNEQLNNRDQDIVLTTHSPYVVSDCHDYRVFKFKRENNKVAFEKIGIPTFGTSFDIILKKAFDVEGTISEEAKSEINDLLSSNNVNDIEKFVESSGPSFEKLALLKRLQDLKEK